MAEIHHLTVVPGDNYHVESDKVLDGAREAKLVDCVIVGRYADGNLYLAHTDGETDTVYLLAYAQHTVLSGKRGT